MSIDELREALSPEVLPLFDAARALIRDIDPDVVEVGWPRQKTAGFGVGPKKMSEQYCYISAYAKHLNLGFYYGADLPDPHGLIGGTGKAMRSMRIARVEDLEVEGLRELVFAATGHLPKLKR
ncbi:MAG: DUF1801 domain-containing protein [Deltaproteobacteria bacterium]|nr:MAG: DUF1801 domain-containing protein [Deltaproteobacteria bacterium]